MEWSAQITEKTEVTEDGTMSYSFTILGDGEARNGIVTVTGTPDTIQQLVSDKVLTFAQAYELAQDLPQVGDILQIVTNG